MLPIFRELIALVPGVSLEIVFVGPGVPERRNGECIEIDQEGLLGGEATRLTMRLVSMPYHSFVASASAQEGFVVAAPDLIVGLNAGFYAYPEAHPTIEALARWGEAALGFTDFSQESAVLMARTLDAASLEPGQHDIEVEANPFGSPARKTEGAVSSLLGAAENAYCFVVPARGVPEGGAS